MCDDCRARIRQGKDFGATSEDAKAEAFTHAQLYVVLDILTRDQIIVWVSEQLRLIAEIYNEPVPEAEIFALHSSRN